MKKKSISYSDLSSKELESLKEYYIQKKIASMSHERLREFALEIISYQIKNTIGKEEEIEAWNEMSEFFTEEFEIIIKEIQSKNKDEQNINDTEKDPTKKRQELLEKNNLDTEKQDMWDD
tara:strand:+ start:4441 stop:4800 length:360 start_codon:yes stop_codon:yes gene_type:complete